MCLALNIRDMLRYSTEVVYKCQERIRQGLETEYPHVRKEVYSHLRHNLDDNVVSRERRGHESVVSDEA
jgi:hypothetical protein